MLDDKREGIIRTTINAYYLKQNRPTVSQLVREVQTNCMSAGLKPPHRRTITARLEDKIEATVSMAIERDGAEAIVLGCAGMAALSERLSDRFGIPVVDGVASAIGLASTLVRMGLSTSRQGLYALSAARAQVGGLVSVDMAG